MLSRAPWSAVTQIWSAQHPSAWPVPSKVEGHQQAHSPIRAQRDASLSHVQVPPTLLQTDVRANVHARHRRR